MPSDLVVLPVEGAHRRRPLPEEVATYVRELIISGAVRPGEFLRLEPLANAIGVSTTPVREGLLSLSNEGFVRLVPRRGFVVAPFTEQDVHDLFWAQAQLGSELAARAAKNVRTEQLTALEANLVRYEQAVADGHEGQVAALGHMFHREINHAAASPRLALLHGSFVKHLPNRFYAAIEGQVDATRDIHPQLIVALRAGDASKARSLMYRHILEGADRLIALLYQRGLWSSQESAS